MMRAVVTLFIVLGVIATCRAECNAKTFLEGKFQRCQTLNPEYDLYWTVSGPDVIIGLNLRGYANPWMGLGISVNGGMMGGDIALARIENGNYTLEDRFATQFDTPQLDKLQNLQLISASSVDQNTIIVYKRKLVSCDVDEDQAILANATQVIFAYGVGSFTYHGPNHRGTAIVFFHFEPEVLSLPATFSEFNVTMPPYEMPAQDTTYTCVSFILPRATKYHIVRWRPIIANPKHIHHMVLFGCYFDANTTVPYECPMAPSSAGCGNVMIAWTIGQTGNDFLGEYALPMGLNATAATYVVLQIHYNNPQRLAGVVDTSGLQLIYSTELRKYDIGTVPMSVPWANGFLVLPPGKKEVYKYTRCHSECTSKSIPAEGITMINWFPHMHQYGSKIWLSHIRNGVELQEIHRDNNYDFERQQNFPVYRKILPGDSLIMNCVWDTSAQTTAIYGGESSSEEMCIGIFQYFPATTPPAFTRCTDLHDYLNTTGNDASYSTCTKNNGTAINPVNNLPFSGGVTNVIANPPYTVLPAPKSTCQKNSAATTLSAVSIVSIMLTIVLCLL